MTTKTTKPLDPGAPFTGLAKCIHDAAVPEDVFGDTPDLDVTYRALAKVIHPDKHMTDELEHDQANAAFIKLSKLYDDAQAKKANGTYGDRKPVIASTSGAPRPTHAVPIHIKTKTAEYVTTDLVHEGGISDLYRAHLVPDDPSATSLVLKIVQASADNDLLENEATILKALYPSTQDDEKFFRYLPKLQDSFVLRGDKGSTRKVNVLPEFGGYYSLADVARAYPDGLDWRDCVWMFKRLLAGIGFAHEQGFVHGAVVPQHVLVHPVEHGAKIIDWTAAIHYTEHPNQHIKVIRRGSKHLYPPEVFAKAPATPQVDIFMAAQTALTILDRKTANKRFLGFLDGCTMQNPKRRPDSAWNLHQELDELLQRTVGKPRYRPLAMPTKPA